MKHNNKIQLHSSSKSSAGKIFAYFCLFFFVSFPLWAADVIVDTVADELDGSTSDVASLIANPGGTGISLREAMTAINNDPSPDVVEINFSGTTFPGTIVLTSHLPTINKAGFIFDGTGKGAVINGGGSNNFRAIRFLEGAHNVVVRGLRFEEASSHVRFEDDSYGLVEENVFLSGIYAINFISNHTQLDHQTIIRKNYIGTDENFSEGDLAIGVELNDSRVLIGGPNPEDKNYFGFTRDVAVKGAKSFLPFSTGIYTILNNYIGTNENGDDLSHSNPGLDRGVWIGGATEAIIGKPNCGNVIGFFYSGIVSQIHSQDPTNSLIKIQGNYIGTNKSWMKTGNFYGVVGNTTAPNSTVLIGGSEPGEGNWICFSEESGIFPKVGSPTVQGNYFGINENGNDLGNHTSIKDDFNFDTSKPLTVRDNVFGHSEFAEIYFLNSGLRSITIQGNTFGIDSQGNAMPSPHHIYLQSLGDPQAELFIGGTQPGEGNTFGFATDAAIKTTFPIDTLHIEGNNIGTDAQGKDLGNGVGIEYSQPGSDFRIGSLDPQADNSAANTIAFNKDYGIKASGNALFRGNSIHSNGLGGILGSGNFSATLTSVVGDLVTGTNAPPGNIIDVYANLPGENQARRWVGSGVADTQGDFSFFMTNSFNIGEVVTATRTDAFSGTSMISPVFTDPYLGFTVDNGTVTRNDLSQMIFGGLDSGDANYFPDRTLLDTTISISGTDEIFTNIFGTQFHQGDQNLVPFDLFLTPPIDYSSTSNDFGVTKLTGFDPSNEQQGVLLNVGSNFDNTVIDVSGSYQPDGSAPINWTWKVRPEPTFNGSSSGLSTNYTMPVTDAVVGYLDFTEASLSGVSLNSLIVNLVEEDLGTLSGIANLRLYKDDGATANAFDPSDTLMAQAITNPTLSNLMLFDQGGIGANHLINSSARFLLVCDLDPTPFAGKKELRIEVSVAELAATSLLHGEEANWVSSSDYIFSVFFDLPPDSAIVNTVLDENDGDTSDVLSLAANPGGTGISLREAIIAINNDPKFSKIFFDSTDFAAGTQATISVMGTSLPSITRADVEINAFNRDVILDGTGLPSGVGLTLNAPNFKLTNLEIFNFSSQGLAILDPAFGTVDDCVIGLNKTGIFIETTAANETIIRNSDIGTHRSDWRDLGNTQNGIVVTGSANVTLGGVDPDDRNYICFHDNATGAGIEVLSGQCRILGNLVGTNPLAENLGNFCGIDIGFGATDITIGSPRAGNVIGHSVAANIEYENNLTGTHRIQGNHIGTDPSGNDLGSDKGIRVNSIFPTSVPVTIGGPHRGEGNVIGFNNTGIEAFNFGHVIVLGNRLGTNAQGDHLGNILSMKLSNNATGLIGRPGAANVFGFATLYSLQCDSSTTYTVKGNWFGTDASGRDLGGNTHIFASSNDLSVSSQIGGSAPGEGNVFAFANGVGQAAIHVNGINGPTIQGNLIGTNEQGKNLGNYYGLLIDSLAQNYVIGSPDPALSNSGHNTIAYNQSYGVLLTGFGVSKVQLRGNSLHSNLEGGIKLDNGANGSILTPDLIASDEVRTLKGQRALPGASLDVYANPLNESQARTYIGSALADAAGNFSFLVPLQFINQAYTVTQTFEGATSEISNTQTVPLILASQVNEVASDGLLSVTGTTFPNATLELIVDGVVIATTVADAQGHFSFLNISLPLGTLSFTIQALSGAPVSISSVTGGSSALDAIATAPGSSLTLGVSYKNSEARVFELDRHYRTTGHGQIATSKLAAALSDFSTVPPSKSKNYEKSLHDAANNITEITDTNSTFDLAHNNMNETENIGAFRNNMVYDDLGRLISYEETSGFTTTFYRLTWDMADRLVKVQSSLDGSENAIFNDVSKYEYYPDGSRAVKRVFDTDTGTETLRENYYGKNMMVHEVYHVDTLFGFTIEFPNPIKEFVYEGMDRPCAIFTNADSDSSTGTLGGKEVYFYHSNPKGDVYALSAGEDLSSTSGFRAGDIVERYDYSLFGQTKVMDGQHSPTPGNVSQLGNPFQFAGAYQDEETGFMQMRYRYYDAGFRGFISRDPLEDDSLGNLYAYVENNPGSLRDPYGLASEADKAELKTIIGDIQIASHIQNYSMYLGSLSSAIAKVKEIREKAFFGEFLWKDDEFEKLVNEVDDFGAFPQWQLDSQTQKDLDSNKKSKLIVGHDMQLNNMKIDNLMDILADYGGTIDDKVGNIDTAEIAAEIATAIDVAAGILTGSAILKQGLKQGIKQGNKLVKVTRWQTPPSETLQSGDWVMKGSNTYKNWLMSGKNTFKMNKYHVPKVEGRTFQVPKSQLQWPKGLEKFKGSWPWGQRMIK